MRPRVVIVGAGFAGITAARTLKRAPVDVTVVDRNNYHLFTPLLYQVASALLDPSEIAQPVRSMLRRTANAEFRLASVTGVNLDGRRVMTDQGELPYDYLLLAPGSTSNFFGIPGLEEAAYPLKDLEQALALRNHALQCFEQSRWEPDLARRRCLLRFVVVGGGPTGVEYAGALSELFHLVVQRDYGRLGLREVEIVLVEAADRLLGAFDASLAAVALRSLERKGVQVRLGTSVSNVTSTRVELSDGTALDAATIVLTAGVHGSPLGGEVVPALERGATVAVEPTLQLPGRPEVFVAGDLAFLPGGDGRPLPMLAPVAMQQGEHAAHQIAALAAGAGDGAAPFRYHDRGTMATVGRNSAVVQIGRFHFTGFIGWLTWLTVHLLLIISFRNRLIVLLNWAYDYVFYDRPVRLILRAAPRRE